jgi:hypothetical protein
MENVFKLECARSLPTLYTTTLRHSFPQVNLPISHYCPIMCSGHHSSVLTTLPYLTPTLTSSVVVSSPPSGSGTWGSSRSFSRSMEPASFCFRPHVQYDGECGGG